jgi:hypothetical protein
MYRSCDVLRTFKGGRASEDPTRLTGLNLIESNSGFPQDPNQLRRSSSILPTHHSQYRPSRKEESYHTSAER